MTFAPVYRLLLSALLVLFPVAALATDAADAETEAETEMALGDAAIGEELYKKECRACHGRTAKGASSYPKLRGQTVEYLVDKLERYRAGERFGPNTPLMAPRAKKLSDEDILNVSTFIVSLDQEG